MVRAPQRRPRLGIGFFVFFLTITIFGAAPQDSDRVVAVGDIHGNLDGFVAILQRAQLIDPLRRWSGGRATLVQTGDFLDRGPKSREVMDLLMTLQREAPRRGGKVIVLMGNHEVMNIIGDMRYVTPNDYESFADDRTDTKKKKVDPAKPAGFGERCDALEPEGKYGKWLRSLPAIVKVKDSIFLHGGINPELATYTIDKLNEGISTELKAYDTLRAFLVDKKIAGPCDSLEDMTAAVKATSEKAQGKDLATLQAFMGIGSWLSIHDNGPLWFRGYAQWSDAEGAPLIEKLTQAYGVARFVVGHTPQLKGAITSRFGGKVYLIDTGMLSSYYEGGRASALNIQDGKVSFIY